MYSMAVENFHPLYKDIKEMGFEHYIRQNFIRDDAQLEVYFTTYYRTYTPENGGHFITLDTFERDGQEHKVDMETLTLHLAFIGVNEEKRKNKVGTQLLSDVGQLADKYNLRMELDIDESFGVPSEKLRSWYERFGFMYLGNKKMIRFSFSERVAKLIPVKGKWRELLEDVSSLYLDSSKDEGYGEDSRREFKEFYTKLKKFSEVEYWGYDHLYWIVEIVKESDGLVSSFEREGNHPEYEPFLKWANDSFKWSKNKDSK